MTERFCPSGQHYRPERHFRVSTNGRRARDCMDCERARRAALIAEAARKDRAKREAEQYPGVDIDRIHYQRGAIRRPARRGEAK